MTTPKHSPSWKGGRKGGEMNQCKKKWWHRIFITWCGNETKSYLSGPLNPIERDEYTCGWCGNTWWEEWKEIK